MFSSGVSVVFVPEIDRGHQGRYGRLFFQAAGAPEVAGCSAQLGLFLPSLSRRLSLSPAACVLLPLQQQKSAAGLVFVCRATAQLSAVSPISLCLSNTVCAHTVAHLYLGAGGQLSDDWQQLLAVQQQWLLGMMTALPCLLCARVAVWCRRGGDVGTGAAQPV